MNKPAIAKGTRDFLPEQSIKRRYIFDLIEEVFRRFGYRPIETPSIELLSTLTGKYGEEGDRLLFKVLNNGDFLKDADREAIKNDDSSKLALSIAKRGLRYDLTVPFARFVSMNRNDLALPFKRFQIQPVWRGDKPQKGRYQEFYQCDVDVVGSTSLIYEAELLQIYDEVFAELNLPVEIKVNNRKILAGIAEVSGVEDKLVAMTVSVDKLDKIGWDGVGRELEKNDFSIKSIEEITRLFKMDFENLREALKVSTIGSLGLAEVDKVFELLENHPSENDIVIDTSLARGLNYYTGFIVEVLAKDADIGSIGGGGRYDDLTSVFGFDGVSGVGISFGAERIYDVLEDKNLFPETLSLDVDILLLPMDDKFVPEVFTWLGMLRSAGVNADMYPEGAKIKKQMKYAAKRGVPRVGIIGETEMAQKEILVRDMISGDQQAMTLENLISALS